LTAHWGATPCIKIVRTMGFHFIPLLAEIANQLLDALRLLDFLGEPLLDFAQCFGVLMPVLIFPLLGHRSLEHFHPVGKNDSGRPLFGNLAVKGGHRLYRIALSQRGAPVDLELGNSLLSGARAACALASPEAASRLNVGSFMRCPLDHAIGGPVDQNCAHQIGR
jgi:hypothetical protein